MVSMLWSRYIRNLVWSCSMSRLIYSEDWTFESDGRMKKRQMSGNEMQISEDSRWFKDNFTAEDIDSVPIGEEHW